MIFFFFFFSKIILRILVIGLILSNPKPEDWNKRDVSPYFASKATVVMCPNQLVHQWQSEIENYSEKKMNIIQLTTIIQVKKYSYQDIMDAGTSNIFRQTENNLIGCVYRHYYCNS